MKLFSYLFIGSAYLFLISCSPAPKPQTQTQNVAIQTIMGMEISFDTRPGDLAATQKLLLEFSLAFQSRSTGAMRKATTEDFVWHMNSTSGNPSGKEIKGVDAVISMLNARQDTYQNLRYSNNKFYGTATKVFHAYRVNGTHVDTGDFAVNGLDMYDIRDGKISRKDSYWKIQQP